MRKFLYIPKHLETYFEAVQRQWLGQSETAYMLTVGVYQETAKNYSDKKSKIKAHVKTLIPEFVQDIFFGTGKVFELQGFCLEANSTDIPPNLHKDIVVFDSAEGFLTWKGEQGYE